MACLSLKLFVVDLYTVPQNGMYPGIARGGRFLGLKHPFGRPSDVHRGDVIVFRRTIEDRAYQFVWRVIGLPGDRVDVGAGFVKVNGQSLPHKRIRTDGDMTIFHETDGGSSYEIAYHTAPRPTAPAMSLTVPPDEFFVLGDNRDNALDSRFAGPVPFASIVARKLYR